MRIAAILLAALLVPAFAAFPERSVPAPFTGSWQSCEDYQGSSICAWRVMVQSGTRVCGMQQDFATNAYYTHRLIGTAEGNRVHFDRICGDPGSETSTYCAEPPGLEAGETVQVGWGRYDLDLDLCNGRLSADPAGCPAGGRASGMPRVPASRVPLPAEDRAWLASCAAGRE
jgi:hypothetical protein